MAPLNDDNKIADSAARRARDKALTELRNSLKASGQKMILMYHPRDKASLYRRVLHALVQASTCFKRGEAAMLVVRLPN
jgi:hypothetical protein